MRLITLRSVVLTHTNAWLGAKAGYQISHALTWLKCIPHHPYVFCFPQIHLYIALNTIYCIHSWHDYVRVCTSKEIAPNTMGSTLLVQLEANIIDGDLHPKGNKEQCVKSFDQLPSKPKQTHGDSEWLKPTVNVHNALCDLENLEPNCGGHVELNIYWLPADLDDWDTLA